MRMKKLRFGYRMCNINVIFLLGKYMVRVISFFNYGMNFVFLLYYMLFKN